MKTIGILGGMSAASTAVYYDRLNAQAQARLGGLHSASLLIRSLDFADVAAMQDAGDWDAAGALLHREALGLETAGADLLILACNTMHKVADRMVRDLRIPFLHIADATAAQVRDAGHTRPGVLGAAYTMEEDFFLDRLRAAGQAPLVPGPQDRATVHAIIYGELCKGIVTDDSRAALQAVAGRLAGAGADCVILGCTEIGLLLNAGNVALPVFDTLVIHCDRALDLAMDAT